MDVVTRPVLAMRDVVVAYDGAVPALEGVSGEVCEGERVALIGPNGAGKTTLIRAVLGLAPLVRGEVLVDGLPAASARHLVGYVPQAETLDADFPVDAQQVVLMGRYRRIGWVRRPGRADKAAALAALDAVGLADRARDRFGTLSGGQRQRVLLARALVAEPRLLLLDEPFSGVDTVSQTRLLAALDAVQAGGAAVLLSTHDLGLAHLSCDEVCLLNRHMVAFGPTSTTLTPDALRATYGSGAVALSDGLAGTVVVTER